MEVQNQKLKAINFIYQDRWLLYEIMIRTSIKYHKSIILGIYVIGWADTYSIFPFLFSGLLFCIIIIFYYIRFKGVKSNK